MKEKAPTQEIADLLFGVRRSIRYHHHRRRFFDRINKVSTVFSALSGSATIIALLSKATPALTITFAATVAVLSAIDLVFSTAQSARDHHDFAKRFILIEKQIINDNVISRKKLSHLISERLDIEAEEPPPLRVLDAMCHNELVKAMGLEDSEVVEIYRLQRILAQLIDLDPHKLKKKSDQ